MSYATVTDVQALARSRKIGQGQNPTQADVAIYLELVEAEINAILTSKGYQVPINKEKAPLAYALLRRVTAQGAVAQMEQAAGNGPNVQRTEQVYQASLTSLMNSREILDAETNVERSKPRGPGVTTTGELLDTNIQEGWEGVPASPGVPYFKRTQQF